MLLRSLFAAAAGALAALPAQAIGQSPAADSPMNLINPRKTMELADGVSPMGSDSIEVNRYAVINFNGV